MLWILVVSSASSKVSGGKMVVSRLASMDLPVPGGPISRTLCPPAAAISSARLTDSWPLTSAMSVSSVEGLLEDFGEINFGRVDFDFPFQKSHRFAQVRAQE